MSWWSQYQTYLKSDAWRKRRVAFIRFAGGKCFCGTTQKLRVHHVTYARMGHELNADLRLVCETHHELIHKYHKSGDKTLEQATDDYIRMYRSGNTPRILTDRERKARLAKKPWKSLNDSEKRLLNRSRYESEKALAKRKRK